VCLGEHKLLSDNTVNFRFAIDEEGKGRIIPRKITMTANYGIYENFDTFGIEDVYGWSSINSDIITKDGYIRLDNIYRYNKTQV
jgi:hypothetical protein